MRILVFLIVLLVSTTLLAAEVPKPGPKSLCPVCGMLVAKYPNWIATIVWKNGHAHYFDGAKDMFKFLHDLAKYAPGHKREEISAIYVTEFYGLEKVDAKKALFVTGSDVLGPMGNELVPLATPEDAADFLKDHKGKRILGFEQVGADVPVGLDAGRF
jgi:copper chaperone NosL